MSQLLIVTCHDSFLKASYCIAEIFKDKGYTVNYFIQVDDKRIDKDHFRDIGFFDDYQKGMIADLFIDDLIFKYDAIMLSLDGPSINGFLKRYYDKIFISNRRKRPILFSGYVGIVYENFIKGFLDRQGVDVFYVNSEHDLNLFSSFSRQLGLDYDNIKLTGLPMLDLAYRLGDSSGKKYNSILFACQPTVPKAFHQRKRIASKFIEYAKNNPEKKIYFKPRHKPQQSTFHIVKFHYHDIFSNLKKKTGIPPNLIITYDPILELLKKVDLCVTISSTASFEAICMGKEIAYLTDFGISELYGNHYFIGSGCMASFRDIMNNKSFKINEVWKNYHFLCDGKNSERVFMEVNNMIEKQNEMNNMIPLRRYYNLELSFDEGLNIKENRVNEKIKRIKRVFTPLVSRIISKTALLIYR